MGHHYQEDDYQYEQYQQQRAKEKKKTMVKKIKPKTRASKLLNLRILLDEASRILDDLT